VVDACDRALAEGDLEIGEAGAALERVLRDGL
jgi:hypothetical protein